MKAIVYTKYGPPDVLQLTEVAKPTPQENEVLIKVQAAALNAADWYLLQGKPFLARLASGLFQPKNTILGADVAGQVEAVGSRVTQFQPGDPVFGDISGCGWGGLAEYVCAREDVLARKPGNVTWESAAAAPMAAVTALQGLRDKGEIRAGKKVLIHGASGGVGTFAVQIAKSFGAHVTAVCSTGKIERARSLGADEVIDYTREDFSQNGHQYDLILAVNGHRSIFEYRRALTRMGIYVMIGGSMAQIFQAMLLGPLLSMGGRQKLVNVLAQPNQKDLIFMQDLLETGKVAAVIDRCYPLEDAAQAFRYLGAGHACGKVVITVEQE